MRCILMVVMQLVMLALLRVPAAAQEPVDSAETPAAADDTAAANDTLSSLPQADTTLVARIGALELLLSDTTRFSAARRQALIDSIRLDSVRTRRRTSGKSFIILSLIKSIAGAIPEDEFFDIRLRFMPSIKNRLPLFSLGSIDVSLSTRRDTLGEEDRSKLLTDASYALLIPLERRKPDTLPADRLPFAGAVFKVFNTRSYLGIQAGAMELSGSRLEGSSVTFSLLRDLYPSGPVDTTLASPQARTNALIEFFLRVPGAQFLDRLRVRGGVLLPFSDDARPETRIVLSVPIVDLERF
jgi:hypothetical protein